MKFYHTCAAPIRNVSPGGQYGSLVLLLESINRIACIRIDSRIIESIQVPHTIVIFAYSRTYQSESRMWESVASRHTCKSRMSRMILFHAYVSIYTPNIRSWTPLSITKYIRITLRTSQWNNILGGMIGQQQFTTSIIIRFQSINYIFRKNYVR